MKELSIFVDESGDFGEYNYHSPYYIITMVFHNQSDDISQDIHKFNSELALLGFDNEHCVHNGPIIRREAPKQISAFISENYNDFLVYDRIKVYYDNGQIELT